MDRTTLKDAYLETLAEIRGFFHAFEWVNHKTNHGYSFEISVAAKSDDLNAAVAAHFQLRTAQHHAFSRI